MNQPPSLKTIHIFAIAAGVLLVGIFFWSTLGAFAFNGPTQSPSGGSGAIGTDASNNVYIGGNLNVTGTITSANAITSAVNAENISAGEFGSDTGGGNFDFPNAVWIGTDSAGGDLDSGLVIEDSGNYGSLLGGFALEDPDNDFFTNDQLGDFDIFSQSSIALGYTTLSNDNSVALYIASSTGYVGIGTTNPATPLEVVNQITNAPDLTLDSDASNSGEYINFNSRAGGTIEQGQIYSDWNGNFIFFPQNGEVAINGAADQNTNFAVYGAVVVGGTYASSVAAPANGLIVQGNVGIGVTSTSAFNVALSSGSSSIGIVPTPSGSVYGGSLTITAGTGTGGSNSGGNLNLEAGNSYTSAGAGGNPGGSVNIYAGANNFYTGNDFGAINFYRGQLSGTYALSASFASSTGYFGIGTSTPAYPLTVQGDIYATGNITCGGTCGGGGSSQWTTTSTGIFYNSGNVGIGVTSPGASLTLASSDVIGFDNGSGSVYASIWSAGLNNIDFGNGGTNSGASVSAGAFYSNGFFGPYLNSMSTNETLTVANTGEVVQYNAATANATQFDITPVANDSTGGSATVVFNSSGTSYLDGGNVGIGTSTPSQLLTVGNANQFTVSSAGNVTSSANISAATFKENGSAVSTSTGAIPGASIGLTAVNGSANTFMRSDAAPTIDQTAAWSFSGLGNTTSSANISAASLNVTGGGQTGTITAPTKLGQCASSTVAISGATSSTGAVFVSPLTYPGTGYVWQGYVSALGTVVVEECAATSTSGSNVKFNAIYIK